MNQQNEFYHVHEDKKWVLTGYISFIVMKDHDLTEADTSDEHFQQVIGEPGEKTITGKTEK